MKTHKMLLLAVGFFVCYETAASKTLCNLAPPLIGYTWEYEGYDASFSMYGASPSVPVWRSFTLLDTSSSNDTLFYHFKITRGDTGLIVMAIGKHNDSLYPINCGTHVDDFFLNWSPFFLNECISDSLMCQYETAISINSSRVSINEQSIFIIELAEDTGVVNLTYIFDPPASYGYERHIVYNLVRVSNTPIHVIGQNNKSNNLSIRSHSGFKTKVFDNKIVIFSDQKVDNESKPLMFSISGRKLINLDLKKLMPQNK